MRVKFKKYLATQCTDRKSLQLQYFKQSGYCCAACSKRRKQKCYGGSEHDGQQKINYPSWKLVSKNKKQWMEKTLHTKKYTYRHWTDYWYVKITW